MATPSNNLVSPTQSNHTYSPSFQAPPVQPLPLSSSGLTFGGVKRPREYVPYLGGMPMGSEILDTIKKAATEIFRHREKLEEVLIPRIAKVQMQCLGESSAVNSTPTIFDKISEDFYKEIVDKDREKSFRLAVTHGMMKIIGLHIANGMDVNFPDEEGNTALTLALRKGRLDVVAKLKEGGAKNPPSSSPLTEAIYEKNSSLVQKLLGDPSVIDTPDADGLTPLMHAVEVQDARIVALLMKAKANVESVNSQGFNALMLAAALNNAEILSILLDGGAKLTGTTVRGETAFFFAVKHNQAKNLKLLLKRCPQLSSPSSSLSPLCSSSSSSNLSSLSSSSLSSLCSSSSSSSSSSISSLSSLSSCSSSSLSSSGSSSSSSSELFLEGGFGDFSMDSALLFALRAGKLEMAHLLAQHKIGIFYQEDKNTPLFWAVMHRDSALVKLLVNAGVKLEDENVQGYTACRYAEIFSFEEIVEFFWKKGACNYQGETRITKAILEKDMRHLKEAISEDIRILEKFNSKGEATLMLALQTFDESIVSLLLSAHPTLPTYLSSEQKNKLKAMLFTAISKEPLLKKLPSRTFLETLVTLGVDINTRTFGGESILMLVLQDKMKRDEQELFNFVESLILCKSDLNMKSVSRKTALDFAKVRVSGEQIVKLLIDAGAQTFDQIK